MFVRLVLICVPNRSTGGLDQIGLQSNSRYPHELDCSQPQADRHSQRPQHLETTRVQRATKRHRQLHVPNKHATDDSTGE